MSEMRKLMEHIKIIEEGYYSRLATELDELRVNNPNATPVELVRLANDLYGPQAARYLSDQLETQGDIDDYLDEEEPKNTPREVTPNWREELKQKLAKANVRDFPWDERKKVDESIPKSDTYALVCKGDHTIEKKGSKAAMNKLRKASPDEYYVANTPSKKVGDKFKSVTNESDSYEIDQFDQVVPYISGRRSHNTGEYRDATELELHQRDEIAELQAEIERLRELCGTNINEVASDEQVYPDTAAGAIQALGDMSVWDVSNAKAKPDPQIQGVWMVTNIFQKGGTGGRAIVYLKGYKDPWGDVRDDNDFEDEEFFDEDTKSDANINPKTGKPHRRLSHDEFVAGAKLREPHTPRGKGKRQRKDWPNL